MIFIYIIVQLCSTPNYICFHGWIKVIWHQTLNTIYITALPSKKLHSNFKKITNQNIFGQIVNSE